MNLVILWAEGLPFLDTVPFMQDDLRRVLPTGAAITFADALALPDALAAPDAILLTVHGSAFPKAAWSALHDFLEQGGRWLHLGGSPFSRPQRQNEDGTWQGECETRAYAKELFLNQAFSIPLSAELQWQWQDVLESAPPAIPGMTRAWALQPRFTDTRDYPEEGGTGGHRDARLRTLLYGLEDGKRIVAPLVVIDRLRGPFAGGTWMLLNAELTALPDPDLLTALLVELKRGPIELDVLPTFASYHAGENPAFNVRVRSLRQRGDAYVSLRVTRQDSPENTVAEVHSHSFGLSAIPHREQVALPIADTNGANAPLTPGFYQVEAILHDVDQRWHRTLATGFWIYDAALMQTARPLTCNRDYFERDGKPYLIAGTTYMAGDVSRKFLFEPNLDVWDADFQAMQAAGVNVVRTGLWTGWKRIMLDPGALDEGVLRAFEAFLLTARKYDIPIIFNFFSFLPEAWNGSNPYLDPRSVTAQQEFVAAFTHRFAGVNDLVWDFINEPSFASYARIWSCRPNYDSHERKAWAAWLKEREADFSDEEKKAADPADVWRERWRLTPNQPLDLPALADFQDKQIQQGVFPLRVLDYRLFAQTIFNRWVQAMTRAVRANGNPRQLITVGQDEGGMGERPGPHFHAEVVDFTTNHSWWQNDDLLWDSAMTKTPTKPNVLQETGIMFVENLDGTYRRTPQETARLLARKLALSLASGCAGAIQWCWNTNVFMDDDNEVGIGFLRADGTEKPELDVFRRFAHFVRDNRQRFVGRQLEDVAIVIPYSNLLSVRDTATLATKRAVKALEYTLGVSVRTVSEYHIEQLGDPKVIVLPAPRVLTRRCWDAILAKVHAGATLIVSGFFEQDEYRRPTDYLAPLGLATSPRPIAPSEPYAVHQKGAVQLWTAFQDEAGQKIEMATVTNSEYDGESIAYGAGHVYYSLAPLELTSNPNTSFFLYENGIHAAFARKKMRFERTDDARIHRQEFAAETLFLFSNEMREPRPVITALKNQIFGEEKADTIQADTPGRVALAFRNRETGTVEAVCVLA